MIAWIYFVAIQFVMLFFTIIGWFLLIPFCLFKAWGEHTPVIFSTTIVLDQWDWRPLNYIYGNPEDGVSGQYARVWLNGTTQGPFMPAAWAPWRAYRWSALRNSTDNLKYVFRRDDGPFKRFEFCSWYVQAGWNTRGLPVISGGRK